MFFEQALRALQKQEGDLFVTEFPDGTSIAFRLLTNKKAAQYKMLISLFGDQHTTNIIYEDIFRVCVEDKWQVTQDGDLAAGVAETIAKLVLYLSGVGDEGIQYTRELMNVYRKQVTSAKDLMQRVICSCFSGYKFSDLEQVNYQELVKIYCQAERLLLDQGIIKEDQMLNLMTPEEQKQEEEKKKVKLSDRIKDDIRAYTKFEKEIPQAPSMREINAAKAEALEEKKKGKNQALRQKAEEAMKRRKK